MGATCGVRGRWLRGSLAQGVAGSWLSSLPPLFCCSSYVGLTGCSAFVQGGAPYSTLLSSVFPGVGVDGKHFHGDLQSVFETFLSPPLVCAYLLVAHSRRVFSAACGPACELNDLPIVTETA